MRLSNPLHLLGDLLDGNVGRVPLPAMLTNEDRYRMALEVISDKTVNLTGRDCETIARRALEEA